MSALLVEDIDGSESSIEDAASLIQLGFAEKRENPLFNDTDWTKWDGGIIGGVPVWLNYNALSALGELVCNECNEPLTFLLQIYSPLDHMDSAFHRALYVFCCKKPTCVASSRGFKCLRTQLPRNNSLYCSEPASLTEEDRLVFDDKMRKHADLLCRLCGCKATSSCSQCKVARYCSRQHQRLHWKSHKLKCLQESSTATTGDLDDAQKRFLFPSYEIVVEAEPAAASGSEIASSTGLSTENTADILQQFPASIPVWEDAVTTGGADEEQDAKLTQTDYNKALSENRYDPVYISFLTRMQRPECGQQILRYCDSSLHHCCRVEDTRNRELTRVEQEQGRLYVSKAYKELAEAGEKNQIPRCGNCGSPRAFEFQIMPQLLHYLGVEKNTKIKQLQSSGQANSAEQDVPPKLELENKKQDDLDWGTIDIYTCIGNCSHSESSTSAYLVEHVELQQLPDLVGGAAKSESLATAGAVEAVIEK